MGGIPDNDYRKIVMIEVPVDRAVFAVHVYKRLIVSKRQRYGENKFHMA